MELISGPGVTPPKHCAWNYCSDGISRRHRKPVTFQDSSFPIILLIYFLLKFSLIFLFFLRTRAPFSRPGIVRKTRVTMSHDKACSLSSKITWGSRNKRTRFKLWQLFHLIEWFYLPFHDTNFGRLRIVATATRRSSGNSPLQLHRMSERDAAFATFKTI